MSHHRLIAVGMIFILLAACAPAPQKTAEPTASAPTTTIVAATPTPTASPTPTIIPTATLPPMDSFMKGLVYFPVGWGGDQRPETDWILEHLVLPTGANWIRLHVGCYQDSVTSTQVYCKPKEGFSDESYVHLVKTAHSLGLRVMSEHMIDSSGWAGSWSGEIGTKYNEQQWQEWFASYSKMILHYAELAETAGTDYLIIVSELESTTHREKEWRALIASVRQVYHGKISMAFSEESSLKTVQFWDALDAITVHPYYLDLPYVTDPTVEQLTRAFTPAVDRLEALSKKWNKPILITEIGFWSVHTATQNYNNLDSSNRIDLQEQADLFQAVFNSFYGKEWLAGIFWYAFEGGSNYAEPWNIHNDFIGKPAENVIRSFYGAAPMPTPTPVVFPDSSLPIAETIYDNQLSPSWNNYPPDGDPDNIQLFQSAVAVSGNAIKENLLNFWTLDFRKLQMDWSSTQWLEFDLYVDPHNLPKVYTIGVSLRDAAYQPSLFKVELLQSQFIEGGKLNPGTWQHVRIPLDVFGPMLSKYEIISIDRPGHGSNTPLTIYVDNVILRGKTPESLSENPPEPTPTLIFAAPAQYYDDFNDKTYDGRLNDKLWAFGDAGSVQISQQDGKLELSDPLPAAGEGVTLNLSHWQEPTFGFFEARIMVHYETGSNGNVTLNASSPSLPDGWTEMGLTPNADGAQLHVKDLVQTAVLNDTWYTLRIEFKKADNSLTYFLDGKEIGSTVITNKVTELHPAIQLWHQSGSPMTVYIDYVAIGD